MKTILLLTFIALYSLIGGTISTAFASQNNTEKALPKNEQYINGKGSEK